MTNKQYPRFIIDKPTGDDVFEGQSQTHLANNISDYMRSNDSIGIDNKAKMPRIIGVEGSWGSGKSNVVTKISNILKKDGYYTFTYDAWGHQEDLQRRSILETLTDALIKEKVLVGKVKIQMRNGEEHSAEWKDQLSLLLSNKTTTITKSQPKLSGSAILGIVLIAAFTVFNLLISQFLENDCISISWVWVLIECLPIIIGVLLAIYYRVKDGNWKNVFTLLTQNDDSTIDEQFTSSEEPSIMEFKNWMRAISSYLNKSKSNEIKKIIIVFDNMDRLPSEKVMQLWSAIYTFFAGSDFENIWTIIPYDNRHLCEAIYECKNDGEIKNKFKCFINKTFPIVYIVPQPVITDYNRLFNKYFEDAFGKEEHDQKHICQVFTRIHFNPNPRTVIAFVNELVAMRLQWPDKKYRLQNIALFILKKDYLLYDENSLDNNLVSDTLFKDISSFYPEQESVRTQLCQFAYGLQDESLAGELPLRRLLSTTIKSGGSLVGFVDKPHFVSVLENILAKEVEIQTLDNAVKSLSTLEVNDFPDNEKESIRKKWDMFANMKSAVSYNDLQFDDTLATIIQHATSQRVKNMCKLYMETIQKCEIGNGSEYFSVLNQLDKCLKDSGKDIKLEDVIRTMILEPKHFVEFVIAAGEVYNIYKVCTNNTELNAYVFSEIEKGTDNIDEFMGLVYQDSAFDFTNLSTIISTFIEGEKGIKEPRIVAYVNRLLDKGNGIIKSRFTNSFISQTVQKIDVTSAANLEKRGVEDIIAMYLADSYDIANINEALIPRLANCFEKYMDYSDLLKQLGSTGSACRLLNIYIIKNKQGNTLDVKYAAQNIETIKQTLALDYSEVFSHFNEWKPEWDDEDENIYNSYCLQDLFETYKEYPGQFTNSIVNLGVKTLKNQTKGFLYTFNGAPNAYWSRFVRSFLGTEFLPEFTDNLYDELKSLLDRVIVANRVEYPDLLNKLLSACKDVVQMANYLHEKLNNNFAKTSYQPEVFKIFGKLLPQLGHDMDDNTARGLISHFISPVINDTDCAQIIIAHKGFYIGIMEHCKEMSQDILKSMKTNANVKDVYAVIAADLDKLVIPDSNNA